MVHVNLSSCGNINLNSLSEGIPVITPGSAGYFIEACMVCMQGKNHTSGVAMGVRTDDDDSCYNVFWEGQVTDRHIKAFGGNKNKTTEIGATPIALLLILEVTDFTAIEEAPVGTTVDYFLTSKEIDDTYIFNNIEAYCEIRGIREEKEGNTIRRAVADKVKRLKKQEDLPTYIVVVEFSKPFSRITCR